MMKKEIELILLGCIAKRNEKEEERFSNLLECSEDWAFITGELIRHRLNGNFYTSMLPEQKKYIIGKVSQTFEILSRCYEEYNKNILDFFQRLVEKTDEVGVNIAGLKGVVFNTNIYKLGARRSNDIDVLVAEEDVLVKHFCNTLFDKYLSVTSFHWSIIIRATGLTHALGYIIIFTEIHKIP